MKSRNTSEFARHTSTPYSNLRKLMGKICFLFVLLLSCSMACLARTISNLTTDQSALLAFKAHISVDPYDVLANNWSTTASVCNWIGVSCGVHHQRVTALNLSDMGLRGTIAPHLGNLSFLVSLVIFGNDFHGYLPKELSHLHRIKRIDLGYNSFTGELPSWFGMLPALQQLYLDSNNFTGTIPPSICSIPVLVILSISSNFLHGNIPEEIGNLTNLELLYLGFNQLTGSIPSAIFNISSLQTIDLTVNSLSDSLPADMCNLHLPKLRELYITSNQLDGEIPSGLYKCKELQYLSLSDNEFKGSISRDIGNLTMLKELYLGGNNLEGVIPLEIENLSSLEVLNLQNCSLTGSIPPVFFNISSLRMIDLTNNSMSGSLPMDIHYDLPFLEELYLSVNQLSGEIPSKLWECTELRRLSLSNNKFTGTIPKKIGNLTMLKVLYIGGNNLTGAIPDETGNLNLERLSLPETKFAGLIPEKIFNISTMKHIDLSMNQFIGHLPSSMGLFLPNLERLYISSNELSGAFPISITNASKLTILDMTSNSFSGSIPNTLGNLRLLKRLVISNNSLTGGPSIRELSFLSSLTNCRNLEMLAFSLNPLNGVIPISFGNLSTSLRVFQAYGCKIKGDIPNGIGNLSSLEALSLDINEFTGFIPKTLGRLKQLEVLYLEHNRLQGPIPDDLCQSNKLGNLFLSDNKLYGSIPACLGEVKSLRNLYLNSNKLTSIIPSTLWSLTDLLGLNLSSNYLSGHITSNIGNLKVITQLGLSWNQFSGDIPNTIGSAQSLVSLSLAHNRFQGRIPPSLGNLISLEFLDLSNNNFSGVIPKSLEALRYLKYLNVSFNKLQGEIPTGGHFVNFTAQSFMKNDALCGAPQLQVQPCKTNSTLRHSRSSTVHQLKYILPSIASAILIVALVFILLRRKKWKIKLPVEGNSLPFTWRRVSYYELLRATDSFSDTNLLGTGSFGSVYKGTLSDGMNIAVKVFNLQLEGAFKSFDVECEVIRNTRHRNLVKIISNCSRMDFKALVLEYMPNGSLEKWLYSHNYCLDILQRLNIMIDVALALEYLHHSHTTPIVHCDLKPSNILLDEDLVAHVGDFGIAKLLGEGELMAQTMTLATIGYMAPEYGTQGIVSTRGDVYSYGVTLMETFTRKKPTDELFSGEMSLKHWVNEALHGSIIEAVDTNLIGSEDEHFYAKKQCLSSVLGLAMDCSTDSPEERINMQDVLARLQKIKIAYLKNIE